MASRFYKLEVNDQQVNRMFADLPKVTKKATANTLNFVIRRVNKNIKQKITETYNVPKSAMKFGDLVSIKRANASANIGVATIFIKKRGRNLILYGAKEIGPGISVRVRRSTETINGGFISTWQKGSSDKKAMAKGRGRQAGQITRITLAGSTYKADKRQELWGPQIATLYVNRQSNVVLNETIDKEFQPELDRQFNQQFEKR